MRSPIQRQVHRAERSMAIQQGQLQPKAFTSGTRVGEMRKFLEALKTVDEGESLFRTWGLPALPARTAYSRALAGL